MTVNKTMSIMVETITYSTLINRLFCRKNLLNKTKNILHQWNTFFMSVLQNLKLSIYLQYKYSKKYQFSKIKVANKQNVCEFFVCEGFLFCVLMVSNVHREFY